MKAYKGCHSGSEDKKFAHRKMRQQVRLSLNDWIEPPTVITDGHNNKPKELYPIDSEFGEIVLSEYRIEEEFEPKEKRQKKLKIECG